MNMNIMFSLIFFAKSKHIKRHRLALLKSHWWAKSTFDNIIRRRNMSCTSMKSFAPINIAICVSNLNNAFAIGESFLSDTASNDLSPGDPRIWPGLLWSSLKNNMNKRLIKLIRHMWQFKAKNKLKPIYHYIM